MIKVNHNSDKRVIRTKSAIKNALFSLMENKDISSITVSELTTLANVNRRTFYSHYSNITDILDEVENDLVAALSELVTKYDKTNFQDSTYNLFLGLNKLVTEDFAFYFKIVRVDMRGMLMSRLKKVLKTSADNLINLTAIRHGSEAAVISAFVVGGFFNSFLEWHSSHSEITLERVAHITSRMVTACADNAAEIAKLP